MGSDGHYPEEAPVHRVAVDGYWMDRPAARDRLEDAAAILNFHRAQVRLTALRHQDLTTALRLLARCRRR